MAVVFVLAVLGGSLMLLFHPLLKHLKLREVPLALGICLLGRPYRRRLALILRARGGGRSPERSRNRLAARLALALRGVSPVAVPSAEAAHFHSLVRAAYADRAARASLPGLAGRSEAVRASSVSFADLVAAKRSGALSVPPTASLRGAVQAGFLADGAVQAGSPAAPPAQFLDGCTPCWENQVWGSDGT
jgi:hypothetical protein